MSFDGNWDLSIDTKLGEKKTILTLISDGAKLSGKMEGDIVSNEVDGDFDGCNAKWQARLSKPMPITVKVSALVEGDTITGEVNLGMLLGSASMTGKRA